MSNKNNQTLNSLICAEVEHFIELYTENDDVRKLVTLLGRLDIPAVPSNTSAANPAVAYLDLVIETHLFPSCCTGNDENSKYALPILTMEERDSMSPIHIIRVIAASVVTVRKLRGELDSAVEHQLTEIKGVLPNLHDVGPAYVTPLGGVKVLP